MKMMSETKFLGVTQIGDRFVAKITKGNITYWLGSHADVEMAARAYDRKARDLFGESAEVNFKEE